MPRQPPARVTLRSVPAHKLIDADRVVCEQMLWKLRFCVRKMHGYRGRAVIAEENGVIVGWALVWRQAGSHEPLTAYFYVPTKHRRRGIGTALAQRVRCSRGVHVCPWNRTSAMFFRQLTLPVSPAYAATA